MANLTHDSIDTKHDSPPTDLIFDYYSKRLATASHDSSIHIIENNSIISTISAHSGSVLTLSWSHPKFGSLLASGGADQRVIIYKESSQNKWQIVFDYLGHSGPITAVEWAPHSLGLMLAVASMDGCISVMVLQAEDRWQVSSFKAHANGALSLCWSPVKESLLHEEEEEIRFVSSGADGVVKVWSFGDGEYVEEEVGKHRGSVRSVVWSDSVLSGGDDGVVVRWRKDRGEWKGEQVADVKSGVLSICVNECGNEVAVCTVGETKVFVNERVWKILYTVDETGMVKESS